MNLQRLLFAYARGARIQARYQGQKKWEPIKSAPGSGAYGWEFRIHSDDAHLQYGLVSQGLIDLVLYGFDTDAFPERDMGDSGFIWLVFTWDGRPEIVEMSREEYGMYRLFAVELLADEGL